MNLFDALKNQESIQSFIYRVAATYGYLSAVTDAHNIIDSNGLWYKTPVVQQRYIHLFARFDERYLANILKASHAEEQERGVFSDPTSYTKTLRAVFYSCQSDKKSTGQLEIRYCLDCIKESIAARGYGYFFSDWLTASFCTVHKAPLRCVVAITRSKSFDAMQRILGGKHPAEFISCNVPQFYEGLGDFSNTVDLFKVKFSPCLKAGFVHWLRKHHRDLDDDVAKRVYLHERYELWSKFVCVTGRYKDVSSALIERIFVAMQPKYNEQLKLFLIKNATIVHVNCGITKADRLTEPLAIVKGNTCGHCTKWHGRCPAASQLIKSWFLGETRWLNPRNRCDEFLRDIGDF
jgi:hypothetical protein